MAFCAEPKGKPQIYNFPQLLGDQQLRGRLQWAPDIPALKAAVTDWLRQQWPQQENTLLDGRAAVLAR